MDQVDRRSTRDEASGRRVERIREIAAKLLDLTVLNTAASRARCRELAAEIVQLTVEEDATGQPARAFEESRKLVERLDAAMRACRDVVEQSDLNRLYSISERMHRQKPDNGAR